MNEKICMVLKALSVNLPVIREFGCAPDKLMVLVVAKGESVSIIRMLEGFKGQQISEIMTWKEIRKSLEMAEPGFTFFVPSDSRRSKDVISLLTAYTKELGTKENMITLPLVVTESLMLSGPDDDYFTIFFDEGIAKQEIPLKKVVPPEEQIEVIRERVSEIVAGEKTQMEKSLLAAACCLYPMIKMNRIKGDFQEYIALVDRMVEQEEDARDTHDLVSLFRKQLISWQKQTKFGEVYFREKISLEVEKRLDEVILYDSEKIYIPEKIFREICKSLTNFFPIKKVKAILREEKLLECLTEKTYTSKCLYYNSAGVAGRKRMLKFKRDMLTEVGEMDFIDLCLSSSKEDENETKAW